MRGSLVLMRLMAVVKVKGDKELKISEISKSMIRNHLWRERLSLKYGNEQKAPCFKLSVKVNLLWSGKVSKSSIADE